MTDSWLFLALAASAFLKTITRETSVRPEVFYITMAVMSLGHRALVFFQLLFRPGVELLFRRLRCGLMPFYVLAFTLSTTTLQTAF